MRVLIVDDEPHIRLTMRLTLEASGYEVDEADSGEAGLSQFGDGGQYDVVLLDQKMPGIDGLETLQRIRERTPDACVVMVTAFASIELAVEAMKHGATDFLRKPMTPETLRGAIAAAVAKRPHRSAASAPAGTQPVRGIETLTLNGFRIARAASASPPDQHVFRVTRFPDRVETNVTVTISPEAVGRVARLAKRNFDPKGAFWRAQAERRLSTALWADGRTPPDGRLTVDDISREDLDAAVAWTSD